MRQITITIFAVLLIFTVPSLSPACTSFAVYSEQTIYGMNFDYTPNSQQMFSISTGVQGKIFQFRPYGFGDMAGMNIKGFNIEKGMEVLRLARNNSNTYLTRCSMVFDPQKGEIYISLEANFDRIWKISLEKQVIETHRGFASSRRQHLPATGLPASELLDW